MRYLKLFFVMFLLLFSLNNILTTQNNSEHEEIIKFLREADGIKFLIDYKIDGDKIIGYKERCQIAAIDRFNTLDEVMKIMGKYFSPEAAMLELEKIGLFMVNGKIGRILADGDPIYCIVENSTFEFIVDEEDVKLIKIAMGSIDDVDEHMDWNNILDFYYKLKKQNNQWKIVDESTQISHYNNNWVIIYSSSCLYGFNLSNYGEYNLFDKNANTAWVEGALDDGIGEWVEFSFCLPINISRIGIINGYAKSQNIYEANNRVKRLKIVVNSASCFEVELKDNVMDYQIINLPKEMSVERIRFIILDVYHGKKYHDTCISEIKFE